MPFVVEHVGAPAMTTLRTTVYFACGPEFARGAQCARFRALSGCYSYRILFCFSAATAIGTDPRLEIHLANWRIQP
jgi:hypothetical protein